jgi:thioredoxin-related protein
MKIMFLSLFSFICLGTSPWLHSLEEAQKTAQEKHKYILLNFSGSDWCGPCIRLHQEIFDSPAFEAFAAEQLVLLQADFPRKKQHQLTKEQQSENDKLAEKYNQAGNFPSTVLLNSDGKVIKVWDGYPKQGATVFMEEINVAIHATN